MKFILLIAIVGFLLVAVRWALVPSRRLPRHRIRHMRIRVRLRLHPGRGHATLFEVWLRWGRFAAFRKSGRSRRSMSFWQRALAPASEYSVTVGRGHYRLRIPLEEHAVVKSPPRAGKTGWLARIILRYPGPVLSTTTKHDVFELTSGLRARRGPVLVFNPQGVGGVPSTFRWNPLDGCQDPQVAIRRADAFSQAVSMKGVEEGSFWSAKASDYMRAYMHAAAIAGLDFRHIVRWVMGIGAIEAEEILASAPEPGRHWAAMLAPCWEQHPLCLYMLDWLSELWSVLYLTPRRTGGSLAAQGEWQTRLLPAAVEQMYKETSDCEHSSRSDRRQPTMAARLNRL